MNTQFTSQDELDRLFSQSGIDLRIDDLTDTPTLEDDSPDPLYKGTALNEFIDDASEWMWQFLWLIYEESDVTNNKWVRRRATWIAAYFISMRRGNPGQFIDRYEQIKEELTAVYNRQMFVPDAPVKVTTQPVISNFIIDNRGYAPVERVLPFNSMGSYPGQRTTITDSFPEII